MKYKLYYIGIYGKIACENGELYIRKQKNMNAYEEYNSLNEAKIKAKKFVKKYPLMSCNIINEEKNEKITITADKKIINKAWKNEKNYFLKDNLKRKQKEFDFFILIIFLSFSIFYLFRYLFN